MLPEPPAGRNEGVAVVYTSLTAVALGALGVFVLVGSTLAASPAERLTLERTT